MTCPDCFKRPTKLIEQGREFMDNAVKICMTCDELTQIAGIKKCGLCGCLVNIKIIANVLIKSQCPLGKW